MKQNLVNLLKEIRTFLIENVKVSASVKEFLMEKDQPNKDMQKLIKIRKRILKIFKQNCPTRRENEEQKFPIKRTPFHKINPQVEKSEEKERDRELKIRLIKSEETFEKQ